MIELHYETDFELKNAAYAISCIESLIKEEGLEVGDLNYIFCDDEYLLKVNQEHLNHDYYTDIITFDYRVANLVSTDLFISITRVADNAEQLGFTFDDELYRVMSHGVLHVCGYGDKTDEEIVVMRSKEDYYLEKFKANVPRGTNT